MRNSQPCSFFGFSVAKALAIFCAILALPLTAPPLHSTASAQTITPVGPRMFGLTVDNVSDEVMPDIIKAIREIKGRSGLRPMVRVVFDFNDETFEAKKYQFRPEDFIGEVKHYRQAILKIRAEADVMGEFIDSSAVYRCHYDPSPVRCYEARIKAYAEGFRDVVEGLKDVVDVWEIGNELNGEWVGWLEASWSDPNVMFEQMLPVRRRVAKGVMETYRLLKQIKPDARTALTFYYNSDTVNHGWTRDLKLNAEGKLVEYGHSYDLLEWVRDQRDLLPDVDYVFLSYYEDDNVGVRPNRNDMNVSGIVKTLVDLARLFGTAQFGFGEFAPQCNFDNVDCPGRKCRQCADAQVSYIRRYYIDLDNLVRAELTKPESGWSKDRVYVGGYFYWYFNSDVIRKKNKNTLKALKDVVSLYSRAR